MAAAQLAYVRIVRLSICPEHQMSQSCIIEINKSISELRRHLSCVVCCRLLTDPYEPKGPQCGHYVCRLCIHGSKRLVPQCPKCQNCCDFKSYEETRVVTLLLLCYKSICIYIMLGHIFAKLEHYMPVPYTDSDIPAAILPTMTTQEVILEGSNYDDIMYTFLYDSDLPFFCGNTVLALQSPLREISASITARKTGKISLPGMAMIESLTPGQQVAYNRAIRIVAASAEYVRRHWKENLSSNGNRLASTSGANFMHLLPNRINMPAQQSRPLISHLKTNIQNGPVDFRQHLAAILSFKVQHQAMIEPNETSLSSPQNEEPKAQMVNPEPVPVSGQEEKVDKIVDAQIEMKSQATNVQSQDLLGASQTKKLVKQDIKKNPSSNVKATVRNQEGKSNESLIAREKAKATNVQSEDLLGASQTKKLVKQDIKKNPSSNVKAAVRNQEGKSNESSIAREKANPVNEADTVVQAPPSRKRKSNETLVSVKDKRNSTDIPLRSVKPIIVSYIQIKPPDKPVDDVSKPTVSNQKQRKVCTCGVNVVQKTRSICRTSRCNCYTNGYSCSDCNCHGCKNPHKPDIESDDEKKKKENRPMHDNLVAEKPSPKTTPTVDSKSSYESIILVAISSPEESEHPLVLVENENKEMQCFNVFKDNVAIDPIEIGFHRVQLHTNDPKYKAIPKFAYMPFPPQNTMDESSFSSPLSPLLEESSHPVMQN